MIELREIKFRAWDKVNKCWLDYDELFINQEGEIYEIEERSWAYQTYMHKENLTEKLELVQYTGLSDKNGKEIYEGDIVRYKQRNLEKAFGINDGGDDFVLKYRKIEFRDQSFNVPAGFIKELEVIGNIYETIEQEATQ